MASIWSLNGGVSFGVATDRLALPIANSTPCNYVGDRHIVTFGPNGSGKSRRLLMPNIRRLTDWSLLIIDPKGELAKETSHSRTSAIFDPYGITGLPSMGFNPISSLDPKSLAFPDEALVMAQAIIRVEGSEPHWSASAQDLTACLLMYAALQENPDLRNLGFVRECLGKPALDFREVVTDMMATGIKRDVEELTIKAGRFMDIDAENKELNSILSTTMTQTRWLDSRQIKDSLKANDFVNFSAMRRKPIAIYMVLPANRLASQSSWLRLFITCCIQELIKDASPSSTPVLLMLDEFANLGHLAAIEDTQAMMRGYGVKLWAVLQDLNQLQGIYEKKWESFIANAGVLQAFAPQDATTAEYLSRLSGQKTEVAVSNNAESLSETQVARPVMYPQDFRNMDDGFMTIFTHKVKGIVRAYAPFPSLPKPPAPEEEFARLLAQPIAGAQSEGAA